MTKTIFKKFWIILFVLVVSSCSTSRTTIKVSGAYALYPLMTVWAQEYQNLNPHIRIEVSGGGAGKGIVDALSGIADIGMVSRDLYPEEVARGAVYVSVAKDAVLATINKDNPAYDKITSRGLTKNDFIKIFLSQEIKTWGELIGDAEIDEQIRVYTRADACGAAQTWALYLGNYTQEDLTKSAHVAVLHDPDLAEAIRNDVSGIGYNNINFVYNLRTGKLIEGISPVPIDLNEDGIISADEYFYDTREDLMNAIKTGVYPAPPVRDLHLLTKNEFTGETKKFIKWILTDGQKYIPKNGYVMLSDTKIQKEFEKIRN